MTRDQQNSDVTARRIRLVVWFLALLFAIHAIATFVIQVVHHQEYLARARGQQLREQSVPAPRGEIRDRNGRLLATSVHVDSLSADLRVLRTQAREQEQEVTELLDMGADRIGELLGTAGRNVWLTRHVPASLCANLDPWLRRGRLPGIRLVRETRRLFPAHPVAASVLGFVRGDVLEGHEELGGIGPAAGVEGIEAQLNKTLAGEPGRYMTLVDAFGNEIPGTRRASRRRAAGETVFLTLDLQVQRIAEQALARTLATSGAASGTTVVMLAETEELLAVANQPNGGDRPVNEWAPEHRRNSAFVEAFEPGGVVSPLAKAGGSAPEWPRLFGFGERTGVAFPVEGRGLVGAGTALDLRRGRSLTVTALQLAAAYAALADRGRRRQPLLLRPSQDATVPPAIAQVAAPEVAEQTLRDMAAGAEGHGVGFAAVAARGKIGSGAGDREALLVLVALIPRDQPRLVVVVTARRPRPATDAWSLASPLLDELADATAAYAGQ